MKPIIGGPIKRPIKPIVDTAAMAMEGGKVFDFPAALKTKGTTGETPIPVKNKPVVAENKLGRNTANSNPTVVNIPHAAIIFPNPILWVIQSVINLVAAIAIIKAV